MNVKTFIDRPVLSIVISTFIVLIGIISLFTLPIERFPDIAPPTIVVETSYPGANADVLMKSVIAPLEENLNGVENMIYMSSSATASGIAQIFIYFRQGTNADMAAVNVQNCVARTTGLLPAEVNRIGVITYKRQPSMLRTFALYSPNGTYDDDFISNYIAINIKPEMQRINGIGNVVILGGAYSMRIYLNPSVMAQYNMVPSDIVNLLAEQNIEAATGSFGDNYDQTFQYVMKFRGRRMTEEQFGDIVVKTLPTGENLLLKDVAEIKLGLDSYTCKGHVNGAPGIGNLVFQVAGSNATQINKDLDKLFAQLEKELPNDLKLITMENANDFLFSSIENIVVSLIIALILVILVVYFFLQDFRATLIPAIGIIVSLIGTFAFLHVAGFTLNLLTLFALVLVIGTVVDNSIVVVEAVQARFDAGYRSPYKAAVDAMSGLTGALFTTTLVFMAVFIPVSFMGGTTGTFYKQFGLTMAVSVGISFLSALTLSPALCALLLRPNPAEGEGSKFAQYIRQAYNTSYQAIMKRYTGLSMDFIRRKWLVGISIVAAIGLLAYCMRTTKTGLVPNEDTGIVFIDISTPAGSSLYQTSTITQEIAARIMALPEVEGMNEVAGQGIISGVGSNLGMIIIKLKSWEERTGKGQDAQSIINKIYAITADIHSANIFVMAPGLIPGYGEGGDFEFQVQDRHGGSVRELYEVTQNYLAALRERKEIASAFTAYNVDYPQYMVDIDASKCKRAGVSPAAVLSTLGGYYGGIYASNFNRFSKVYRVMVQASPEYQRDIETLNNVFVRLDNGQMAPISQFLTFQKIYDPLVLNRFNMYTSIGINGNKSEGYSSGDAIKAIKEVAAESLPKGYGLDYSGITREEEKNGSGNTAIIFGICLIFIYLLLAALYESFFLPIAILLSVPFGLLGSFILAKMMGLENNIYLQVGLIMLIGLLSKTAILLTEYATQCRHAGMSLKQAAYFAAKMRMRPILMTALTMIFGMLPLMFANGVGANGSRTIGAGAVGGMLVGTLALLFIVPALFVIFQGLQEKVKPIKEFTPSDDPLIQQEIELINTYKEQKAANESAGNKPSNTAGVIALALLCTVILPSCGLYSKYKPIDTVDNNVYGNIALSDSSSNFGKLEWRQVFTDKELQALISEALANNLDMKIAHEHVKQAEASLSGAKLAYLPSIQLAPSGSYGGSSAGGGWSYDLVCNASWEIDIFGRTWNSMKRAKATRDQVKDFEQAARCGLIASVAGTYYTLLMLDAQLAVAETTEATWGKTVQTIQKMKEAGMANEAGVNQLEANYYAIQTMVLDIKQKISETENTMCLLSGSTHKAISRGELYTQELPTEMGVGVPVQMLYNRPDIRAAQQTMAQAHYARQLATANCLPSLNLSGVLGWTNHSYGTLLDPMTFIYSAAGALMMPIFQSGRNIAQVRAAKSQAEESRLNFTKAILSAGNEVNQALTNYQTCHAKRTLYDNQVKALERAYEATDKLMRYGSTTYLEVLNAQNTLLNAQFTRISNQMEELQAMVALYHALGGGQE